MKVNWCRSCGGGSNFGDQLGPVLLRHYGLAVEWAAPADAELVAVGSILSKIPNGWTGTVLGTGFIRRGLRRNLARARVLAVRGRLTREACRLPASTSLGDLGLLVPDLIAGAMLDGSGIDVLVAPHVVDRELAGRYPDAEVLDLHRPPLEVIATIARARFVVTSSLHALIAADALGVSWQLEPHPAVHGGLWKFDDYATSVGRRRIVVGSPSLSPRAAVLERQAALRELVGQL